MGSRRGKKIRGITTRAREISTIRTEKTRTRAFSAIRKRAFRAGETCSNRA